MRHWLLALLVVAPAAAGAVDSPESWRCPDKQQNIYWKGLSQIPQDAGPAWGEQLNGNAPSPFVWLAIYQARDHDIAERRAPITERWQELSSERKCAYLAHFTEEAERRKREFDALVGWREDGGLLKRLQKVAPEEVVAAQDKEPAKGLRTRFVTLLAWLKSLGLDDKDSQKERAYGVLIKTGLLEAAYHAFLTDSGHYRAKARLRLDEDLKAGTLPQRLTTERSAGATTAALLTEPAVQEKVVEDVASDMERGVSEERALGAGFEGRVLESLNAQLRAREVAAENVQVAQVQRSEAEKRAVRKRAEAVVGELEVQLKDGKLAFDGTADTDLLLSLEEYRRGKRALYEALEGQAEPDRATLTKRYQDLLRDVCATHYRSMRYDPELVKTLCAR